MEKERKATKEELKKKVDFAKVGEELETPKDKEEKPGFNFMELLNDPKMAALLGQGKELFKKKETNPDICEISIKAPSAVVLKLFRVEN